MTNHAPVARGTKVDNVSDNRAPVSDSEFATWLTKDQAAAAIGVTTKTVERLAQDGKIQQARWQRPAGGPRLAVYHPDDVARVAPDRRPGPLPPFVVPGPAVASTNGNGHGLISTKNVLASTDQAPPASEDLLRVLVTAAMRVMSETSQTPTLFVTVEEASAVSGLSQACVRRLIADGTLKAIRDRGWRIRRKDLEAL